MVSFYNNRIYTVVTQTASIVDEWISKIYYDFHDKLNNLVVGLDCEWRVNFEKGGTRNKIAVLQLCVGHQCLIFQFACRDYIPASLHEFLKNEKFIFVGVGVAEDGDKLFEDYGLSVARTIDLRTLAAEKLDFEELEGTGLKGLAFTVLRRDLPKPNNVTLSRWDASLY
ncbi:Werner Syndrome-like exonuclease [Papaver somniferum]|uniref:Werner Syndrome-like exonuclease n=1 Tax=Papaver somniferum TaxID=3469 RepID=UPI000E703147|nr:Werner Syndrome-like exonuclease [Papaver somniferum]